MKAAQLNRRIEIQHKVKTYDESNASQYEWQPLVKVWANIRHTSGAESIKADVLTGTVKASVRIRWRTDVNEKMRVVLKDGAAYEIVAVLPDYKGREYVDLVCERVNKHDES